VRARKTSVVVIETDPRRGTAEGGTWWDVAVTEVPKTSSQKKARKSYEAARRRQPLGA
jgi:3D-(3,5/4)-trihydroxycyclohexane-1,2-dione acylhydrolase (decyclizing)